MATETWQLENARFRLRIQAQGGEVCSLWDKVLNKEWMWSAQKNVWNNSATQLFPVVGRLIHEGIYEGKHFYPLPAHGFLRHQAFSCIGQTAAGLQLEATACDISRAVWPWQWRVSLQCELTDDGLIFSQQVTNEDDKPFWFSIGWHPGFALPWSSEPGWQVCFAQDGVAGPLPTHQRTLAVPENPPRVSVFPLTADSFAEGAVYFAHCSGQPVRVCAPGGKTVLTMEIGSHEWLALWSVAGADLLCIEPLAGTTDAPNFSGQVENKRGMQRLAAGESQTFRVRLRFPVDV